MLFCRVSLSNTIGSCGACRQTEISAAGVASLISETSTFTGTQDSKVFETFHTVNRQSQQVIYIIECEISKLQFHQLEKARLALTYDLKTTEIILKKELVASYELTQHLLQNTRTLNFYNDAAIITILEQTKETTWLSNKRRKSFAEDKHFGKELSLKTLQPNKLNKIIG